MPWQFLGGSAALSLAALSSGCYSVPGQSAPLAPVVTTAAPASARTQELPAAEAAKLCLATAESLEQGGQYAEAIALYAKARRLDSPCGAQATRRLAVLYDRTDQFDKALQEYQRALHDNPRDAELLNNLGYGCYCRGDWAQAEKHLRKAVAIDPRLACAWTNLGMTLAQQMRYGESLNAFENVVPKSQALCNLGFILATQKKFADSCRQYERALELEPSLQIARVALQKLNHPNPQATMPPAPSANRPHEVTSAPRTVAPAPPPLVTVPALED